MPPAREFSPCPHLPALEPDAALDWRALHALRPQRGERFYLQCLRYAQFLWIRGLAARAVLAADRALLTELRGDEPALAGHPLPYLALAWLVASTPADTFVGNPRVHYQHLADRVREPRRAQRSARAWACWYLARVVRPDLPGDPRHPVIEPNVETIAEMLRTHGIPGESTVWQRACEAAVDLRRG